MFKSLTFILSLTLCFSAFSRNAVSKKRYELLSGVRKSRDAKTVWDSKYADKDYVYGKSPAKFLAKNYQFIPKDSYVLDMGMGEGRNAVFLASQGYKVLGVDISTVAVAKAKNLAKEFDVKINTATASLNNYQINNESLDAIICFYYVDRSLHQKMIGWLKPGGIIIYEAHTDRQNRVKGKQKFDRKYLLREGELLSLFPGMRILKYEEPLHREEFSSSIILQKPLN